MKYSNAGRADQRVVFTREVLRKAELIKTSAPGTRVEL